MTESFDKLPSIIVIFQRFFISKLKQTFIEFTFFPISHLRLIFFSTYIPIRTRKKEPFKVKRRQCNLRVNVNRIKVVVREKTHEIVFSLTHKSLFYEELRNYFLNTDSIRSCFVCSNLFITYDHIFPLRLEIN